MYLANSHRFLCSKRYRLRFFIIIKALFYNIRNVLHMNP